LKLSERPISVIASVLMGQSEAGRRHGNVTIDAPAPRRDHGKGSREQPMDQAGVTVELLGRFAFALDGQSRSLAPALQRLLAFLAVHPWPSRYVIARMLWPDHREDAALAALRTAVWRLQHHAPGVLDAGVHTLALSSRVSVDLHDCLHWAQRLLRDPAAVPDDELPPPVLVADLLPGWDDEWLEPERQRLHQLYVHATETAAGEQLRRGRPGQALTTAFTALSTDPLRESTHRLLVGIHLAEGNVDAALRQYRACREALDRDLGVEPSPALAELVAPYLTGAGKQSVGQGSTSGSRSRRR
jgi:DNA-binding SARP family transcriptional activator